MNEDPLQTVVENKGIVVTFIYVVIRWITGWEFKKVDRIEKKLDQHIKESNDRLAGLEGKLGVITERHRIEDRE